MHDEYTTSPAVENSSENTKQGQEGTSALAISSLVCSLILCCPVTTLVGFFLGIAALFTTGPGRKRGRGLAITGLVLGLITSIVWVLPGVWMGGMMMTMYTGPKQVIVDAANGNYAAAGEEFKAGRVPSNEEFERFATEVKKRYGKLLHAQPDQQSQNNSGNDAEVSYIFNFENKTVSGYAVFELGQSPFDGIWLTNITLEDSEAGDLTLEARGTSDGNRP